MSFECIGCHGDLCDCSNTPEELDAKYKSIEIEKNYQEEKNSATSWLKFALACSLVTFLLFII